jgi:hypothetical protein
MSDGSSITGLSEHERRALASVLDEIIPPSPDGRFPGAGALGVAEHVEQALQKTPDLGPPIQQGLSALEALAAGRGAGSFAALSAQDRSTVLDEIATREAAFLPTLVFLAYAGYYRSERVVEALGIEPRPPHPKGYDMEPNDLTLLDDVRRRPKMYRER